MYALRGDIGEPGLILTIDQGAKITFAPSRASIPLLYTYLEIRMSISDKNGQNGGFAPALVA
jgi:hypothetical protein